MSTTEAMLYEKQSDKSVRCNLCAHRCRIKPGSFGFCCVRENVDGALRTHTFGRLIAQHVDPIEKKPLYHVLPGTTSYSVATIGCNFRCDFCQNWQISQIHGTGRALTAGVAMSPEEIAADAADSGCRSIAYTYTEPTIFFEYAYETAKAAHARGLLNLFITNGYMTGEALGMIRPYLDACNVDLKSFRDEFYRKHCSARLAPVLESIRCMREMGIWVEVTTLIIPGQNDSREELDDIARFLAETDTRIPWHISRFHPDYKLTDAIPTPLETLRLARDLAADHGLRYVYVGNVGGSSDSVCSHCGATLIQRSGFGAQVVGIRNGRCASCQTPIEGLWG